MYTIPKDFHCALPIHFDGSAMGYEVLRFSVGEIPDDKRARLILCINTDDLTADDFNIYVNSSSCVFSGKVLLDPHIYPNNCYVFDVNGCYFDIFIAEPKIKCECILEYAEIEVL